MKSLAIKYRPTTFEDTLGQHVVIKILKNQIEKKSFAHAIMFAGSSGCGKTSTAKIVAKLINNMQGEPIEIDAASNSGVDNVRAIIEEAKNRAIDAEYKVFIIDEAQQITIAGWNAFLKTIEEPPEYTIFIFCTTDPQKIPQTILNRVQKFNFVKVPTNEIVERLEYICNQEGFFNYTESIQYIAKISNGCVREAITLLDKCSDYSNNLDLNNVLEVLGYESYEEMIKITNAMLDGNEKYILSALDDIYNKGNDLKLFVDQYIEFILDIDKYILFKNFNLIKIPSILENDIINLINFENPADYYNYVLDKLLNLKNQLKLDSNIKTTIEINFLQITRMQ